MDSHFPMAFGEVEDPVTNEERHAMAQRTTRELGFVMPSLVDGVDDTVEQAYQGWPERLYLIDGENRIRYRGGPGPFGFDPDGLEAAIRELLDPSQG